MILQTRISYSLPHHIVSPFTKTGQEVEQGRAAALQGRGGHAQGTSASQHRALLRLVGGADATWRPKSHARHRAHDVGHTQNVSDNVSVCD